MSDLLGGARRFNIDNELSSIAATEIGVSKGEIVVHSYDGKWETHEAIADELLKAIEFYSRRDLYKGALEAVKDIQNMCIGEITMGCRLDAEYIGRMIYEKTGLIAGKLPLPDAPEVK